MGPMTRCSLANLAVPAIGTAPSARFWIALEQPGPWGAKAVTQSRLDPGLGAALEAHCAEAGGRFLLVRDPLEHPDAADRRRVFVGGGPSAAPWLATGLVQSADDLLRHLEQTPDLDVLPAPPDWLQPCPPVLLVCTNGKRDVCCAEFGGPLARRLATEAAGRVWEATHLGGHRFAATALCLPSRQMVARLDDALGRQALEGELLALDQWHDRGRTDVPELFRAAEAWLRCESGDTRPDAWELTQEGDVLVARRGDEVRRLRAQKTTDDEHRLPESCGKDAKPVTLWKVTGLDEL